MHSSLKDKLQKILDKHTASGSECGCQLAVYQDGELIADLASGYTSADKTVPLTQEHLFPVFSVGKAVATTAVHKLVEKGILSYDTRIGDVWKEFDCSGKENVLLWHVLSHRSGLFQDPEIDSPDDYSDWQKFTSRLAAAEPAWEPGTKSSYHYHTYAYLLGETAARAAGKDFKTIIEEEVIRPLKLENEMFFGTNDEADKRFVMLSGEHTYSHLLRSKRFLHGFAPSFNGVMTARAVAKHYAALEREIDGVRLLKQETLDNAAINRTPAEFPVNDWPRFGLGYVTFGFEDDLSGVIGHGGAAGSEGLLDRRRHLAVGFTKNQVNPNHPVHPVRDEIAQALGLPIRHW